jgi:hypothetical protein
MTYKYDSRIQQLCEQASKEQNSQKLNDLVTELNRAFEEKEEWLRDHRMGCGHETASLTSQSG